MNTTTNEMSDGELVVTQLPTEDEAECERLGLPRQYEVRRDGKVVWCGEASSIDEARERACR